MFCVFALAALTYPPSRCVARVRFRVALLTFVTSNCTRPVLIQTVSAYPHLQARVER
jgi:hypothetical protein